MYQHLLTHITQRTARIGVIGLGYVGLPLATEWARAGFRVTGIDIDAQRVAMCQQGISWIADIPSDDLAALVREERLTATTDIAVLAELDAISICVPTPLNKTKDPDISAVLSAVDAILTYLHQGQLIVLESTTYPGTTDELILPRLSQTGLTVGEDFFLAFSPERIDPGNKYYTLSNTPKIVAGVTAQCLEVVTALYKTVVDSVVPVSSTRVAELVKLQENTFRAVNIGMVNELAIIAHLLGVDVWEVISAAATKPFGFMPFYPGPGLGGHCIPIDPHYLAWKLRTLNYKTRFIEVASEINGQMPRYVVERVVSAMNEVGKCLNGSRILILGVSYKRDVADLRESPALDIIELLQERKVHIEYADPYIPKLRLAETTLTAVPLDDECLRRVDCVVIVTDHSIFDYAYLCRTASLVVDTRNATAGLTGSHIWRL
ncbi:MAG: nucleotide sugar dehydrogenase [Ktedonobacteraceae bacterium]|nr:nucleotide sugar dehydrogenase [Ktedonobacteraceae bacterium]